MVLSLSRWLRSGFARKHTPRQAVSAKPTKFRLLVENLETRATPALSGAIFTTTVDGSAVNANIYDDSCDVYLNGGPNSTGHLDAGNYYFQVEDPSGSINLSTFDSIAQRTVHINSDGRIDAYLGTLHATGTDSVTGAVTVGLAPFDVTPVDHEYKVELILISADDPMSAAVPGDSKTDNFKAETNDVTVVNNLGTISGIKFADHNANGVQDAGDEPLQGWQMTLIGAGADGILGTGDDVTVGTMTTGADGSYSFGNLDAGNYRVLEETRDGWTHTTANPVDVTLTLSQTFSCPVLTNTVSSATVNFGNFQNISISGTKFQDLTGDGFSADDPVLDSTNSNYVSVNINLYKNGNLVATTATDGSGSYSFTDLGPGTYTVSEVVPSGWTLTAQTGATIVANGGSNSMGNNFDDFKNASVTNGGGFTLGFWCNKNGQALLNQGDFNLLNTLNLKNADGSGIVFSGSLSNEKAVLRNFLLGANATNMANMLSAQFATLELNTNHSFINTSAVVDVNAPVLVSWSNDGQGSSLVTNLNSGPDGVIAPGGLISVGTVETEAKSILGSAGGNIVLGGDALRLYEEALKIVCDALNNNLAIIQV
jgi:hypothetical protein